MKHTYSSDETHFQSAEAATLHLSENCTRTQSLILGRAVEIYWSLKHLPTEYPCALYVASQLKSMRADVPTIVSALLGDNVLGREVSIDQIREQFGQEYADLTKEVRWLNELPIEDFDVRIGIGSRDQAENLRRMVLSMVEDIRVVLVKLAYRTQRLYLLAKSQDPSTVAIANETLVVYAPLANRLGLGQLKWELEDVAFRIMEPAAYRRIALALEENRASRENYIRDFVAELTQVLQQQNIHNVTVFGRPKHIYSIWKKMRQKRIEFTDLFDVRAVRVLVDDITQCYTVLGAVHNTWQPISREFDDYIAHPKPNGYRSLHTAVIGPKGKAVEVQIRTRAMDDDAENGVAAHWAYKEGATADPALQSNIDTLKQLLDDSDDTFVEGFAQHLDAERVYVFTPKGEVIDLVHGATPLDFAYHIHSQIGHRCRGAKVNGSIVSLTYTLQNGDRVEVLTTREPSPSRDWLNKSLGYLTSSRSRSKVRAWFNTQDQAQHLVDGKSMLERELKRLKASQLSLDSLISRFKLDKVADLYVAIGKNDISMSQIVGAVQFLSEPADKPTPTPQQVLQRNVNGNSSDTISVRGVGNLMTSLASCCQPVPYDSIVGFITRGKGVTIHRVTCGNMLNLPDHELERLIEVEWGEDSSELFRANISIVAYDRVGLLRDVSTVLTNNKADVASMNTLSDPNEQIATMKIGLHIASISDLAQLMDRLRQLRNVRSVERDL